MSMNHKLYQKNEDEGEGRKKRMTMKLCRKKREG